MLAQSFCCYRIHLFVCLTDYFCHLFIIYICLSHTYPLSLVHEIKGIQDLKIYSHADSLILSHCLSLAGWLSVCL